MARGKMNWIILIVLVVADLSGAFGQSKDTVITFYSVDSAYTYASRLDAPLFKDSTVYEIIGKTNERIYYPDKRMITNRVFEVKVDSAKSQSSIVIYPRDYDIKPTEIEKVVPISRVKPAKIEIKEIER